MINIIIMRRIAGVVLQINARYCSNECSIFLPNCNRCSDHLIKALNPIFADQVHSQELKYGIRTEDCDWLFENYQVNVIPFELLSI